MSETEKRILHLFGEIAAVVEHGNYTYDEAISALFKLSAYYSTEGRIFLSNASILDVAQYRQRQFEKNAAVLDESTAAKDQM